MIARARTSPVDGTAAAPITALTLGLVALAATGCVSLPPAPARDSVPELTDVAFFPQTAYDCGPAALATILDATGVMTTPTALVEQVYVEDLEGSLQAELMAATRRAERIPVPLGRSFDALIDEVASGRPVLVLLNLGFARAPIWHYAVVVGYDADSEHVILRSGEEPRRRERTRRFLRQWQLAEYWAFVAAAPGEIPVGATPEAYLRALVDAEPQLTDAAAGIAYEAALTRWPDDPLALFTAANRQLADANFDRAAELYRRVLERTPEHAAARNNLAFALLQQGCRAAALREARIALASAAIEPFRAEIEDTLRQIEQIPAGAAAGGHCGAG